MVIATQNPIEQEGTYPLPEAQVDRFMLKLRIDYPSQEEEKLIMQRMSSSNDGISSINPVINPKDLQAAQKVFEGIYIDENLQDYIIHLVSATRDPKQYKIILVERNDSIRCLSPSLHISQSRRKSLCLFAGTGICRST